MTNQFNYRSLLKVGCAMLVATLCWVSSASAGNTLVTIFNPGTSTNCGDERCCWQFDFRVDESTDSLVVQLHSDDPNATDDCIDWDCFANEWGGSMQYQKIGNGRFKITFVPAITSGQVLFTLCPKRDSLACGNVWTAFEWNTYSGGSSNEDGFEPLYDCNTSDCVASCDVFRVYAAGGQVFCYTRLQNTEATSVTMTFTPGLADCNLVGITHPPFTTMTPGGPNAPFSGPWTSLVFDNGGTGGDGVDPCETFCVTIPSCSPFNTTTVTMTGDPTPNTCSTRTAVLKPSLGGGIEVTQPDGSVQNFPNPLTRATGFKTTIPFNSKVDGEILLRVYNSAGKLELTQSMVSAAGDNFFELTGEDLPRGTYYYVVESPVGVPIIKETMVVIK